MSPQFDSFWQAYPRRVGKGVAVKVFDKLRVSETQLDEILSAIAEQSRTRQWREGNGRFIPHPATWLRQARWLDEVPTVHAEPTCPHSPPCDAPGRWACVRKSQRAMIEAGL